MSHKNSDKIQNAFNQLMKLATEFKEQRDYAAKIVALGWKTVPKNPVELWRAG